MVWNYLGQTVGECLIRQKTTTEIVLNYPADMLGSKISCWIEIYLQKASNLLVRVGTVLNRVNIEVAASTSNP